MAVILSQRQCVNVAVLFPMTYKATDLTRMVNIFAEIYNKSGVKRLNTLGHLDQYMAQHGRIVKQSYCETV